MTRRFEVGLLGSVLLAAALSAAGCAANGDADDGSELDEIGGGGGHGGSPGEDLFEDETFGGNGRTCATCHPSDRNDSGTLSPREIQDLFRRRPNDPLFRHDAADTIGGNTFDRIKRDATVLIPIPLPPNVRIVGSSAREVLLPRGIPTTMNTPALDPVLMYDGRAPNLEEQARDAILRHAQSSDVDDDDVQDIADFQKTLFNRDNLEDFFEDNRPIRMPFGRNSSERRGRRWFIDDNKTNPNDVGESKFNVCGFCHSGPMLNGLSGFFVQNISPVPLPEGFRFFTVLVSELNPLGNPEYQFEYTNDGVATVVPSADPGIFLITGETPPVGSGWFKIPTVWGAEDTAPYFHDNSAKDFTQMMNHYDTAIFILSETDPVPPTLGQVDLTEQDKKDIIAYMKLL
jgi:Di-haem cytochrome c peroxidase